MNDIEKDAYYTYMKEVLTKRDIISAAEARGRNSEARNIAMQMLKKKMPMKDISGCTGLTIDEIEKLQ